MIEFISRSVAAKITLALTLVVVTLVASYLVMDRRLKSIERSVDDITEISNHAIGILRINKDIVEMQRDISVYGASGSIAVFEKIEQKSPHILDFGADGSTKKRPRKRTPSVDTKLILN